MVRKPVYFSLNGAAFVRNMHLSMWTALMKNVSHLLCRCQTAYSVINFSLSFWIKTSEPWCSFKVVLCKTKLQQYLEWALVPCPNSEDNTTTRPSPCPVSTEELWAVQVCRTRRLYLYTQTTWNRRHTARSHRAARLPAMTALHCEACWCWCWQRAHWNLNTWRNLMFSGETRFCLQQLDRTIKVASLMA